MNEAKLADVLYRISLSDPSYFTSPDFAREADIQRLYVIRTALIYQALALAAQIGYTAGVALDPEDADRPMVVYIELPTGQVSWHVAAHPVVWDNHTTEDKYRRIDVYANGDW